jgi:hypothetical protein
LAFYAIEGKDQVWIGGSPVATMVGWLLRFDGTDGFRFLFTYVSVVTMGSEEEYSGASYLLLRIIFNSIIS